jgi:phosphoserine/homoserine phosphotransferase
MIVGYELRQPNGKYNAVRGLQSLNFRVFAAGDSYNDLAMIRQADASCFFCPPDSIVRENPDIPVARTYGEMRKNIEKVTEKR